MAYCDMTDVEKRLPAEWVNILTNDAGGNTLGEEAFLQATEDSDSLINSYLRSRYAVPFSIAPKIVTRIAVDLTIYYVYQRKFEQELPDAIRARYTDSIKLLEAIQSGRINIEDVPAPEAVVPTVVRTNKTSSDRMFGKSTMDRW